MTTYLTSADGRGTRRSPSLDRPSAPGWIPLAVLMIATFVYVLDFFIVNVALADIQTALHARTDTIEWVVAGYALTTAATLIIGSRLGDRYGRRRVVTIGVLWFVAASAACALAVDGPMLVVSRLLQGVGAGLLAPNILSIIGVVYTGPLRSRAISVYGIVMGLAACTGQLIGGLLVRADLLGQGWRAIFWVNVPIGLVAVALSRRVPESRSGQTGRPDVVGMIMITAALTAVLWPLLSGRQLHWPVWAWASLALAPVLLAGFGLHQRHRSRSGRVPLVDLRTIAARGPATGLAVQLLFWCQQAASYLFLALYLQQGRGLGPIASGGMFAALALGYLITSTRAPALTLRFGAKVVAVGAALGLAADLLLAALVGFDSHETVLILIPGLFLLGAAQGLCITPLTTLVLSFATPVTAGTLSGALSTVQQIGNAVGVGIIGLVFFGSIPLGFSVAFARTLTLMAALLLVVAALSLTIGRSSARGEDDHR